MIDPASADKNLLFFIYSTASGKAKQTDEGFVVMKDSKLRMETTDSCPQSALTNREKYKNLIVDGKLTEDIWVEINTLKEKRYYENKIHHHPGIPRIETVGKRLVDKIMDLVWRMDNDAPGMQEELVEAFYRVNEKMEK